MGNLLVMVRGHPLYTIRLSADSETQRGRQILSRQFTGLRLYVFSIE